MIDLDKHVSDVQNHDSISTSDTSGKCIRSDGSNPLYAQQENF
jgi:hypothetical protein